MELNPLILGAILGAGVLLVVIGLRTLTNSNFDDARRKRGFWPFNAGLILAALSLYWFLVTG